MVRDSRNEPLTAFADVIIDVTATTTLSTSSTTTTTSESAEAILLTSTTEGSIVVLGAGADDTDHTGLAIGLAVGVAVLFGGLLLAFRRKQQAAHPSRKHGSENPMYPPAFSEDSFLRPLVFAGLTSARLILWDWPRVLLPL